MDAADPALCVIETAPAKQTNEQDWSLENHTMSGVITMRYLPETAAEIAGGFVALLFVSMYAFAMSWLRQLMTGWIVNGGLCACASGRMYPVATSTLCSNRSCSRTMKPVLRVVALPMMFSQFCRTCSTEVLPPAMLKSKINDINI